jgi:hypothetical protein
VVALGGGLSARRVPSAACADDESFLVVVPKYRGSGPGQGLLVTLAVARVGGAAEALALNEAAAAGEGDVLGGWIAHRDGIRYASFCPDAAYTPGLAARQALAAARGAGWVPTSRRSSGTRGSSAQPCAPRPSRG